MGKAGAFVRWENREGLTCGLSPRILSDISQVAGEDWWGDGEWEIASRSLEVLPARKYRFLHPFQFVDTCPQKLTEGVENW